jgi:hypothetical protein
MFIQGTLTEGEGWVQSTVDLLVRIACYEKRRKKTFLNTKNS